MSTMVDRLLHHYERDPERMFCALLREGEHERISYRELLDQSYRYAAHYRAEGAVPGDIVLSILQHGPDLIYSFVGALLAGLIPSIMPFPSEKQDPDLYWGSLSRLLERIDARVVVTYDENVGPLEAVGPPASCRLITPAGPRARPEGRLDIEKVSLGDPNEVAFLQHTSGTTGLKKGIALSHRAVLKQVESYASVLHLSGDDRIVSWLPLYHDMGLIACFVMPMLEGVPLVLIDPFEWVYRPSLLFDAVSGYAGTLVWLPNFAFHHLAATVTNPGQYDLSTVRAFIDCSEPCKPATFRKFTEAFASAGVQPERLQTCYAMAETVFAVTQSPLGAAPTVIRVDRRELQLRHRVKDAVDGDESVEFLSVGRVIPGLEIAIVDGDRRPLADDHVGEVAVSGQCLFSGYFREPEATAAVFDGEWCCTGDLGFRRGRELFITGRKKDVIIVNGRNYYAHDIEFAASRVEGVKRGRCVAVSIFNDHKGSEEAVLVAETEIEDDEPRERIRAAVKDAVLSDLALYLGDIHLVPLKWLVKTTSGKISRKENAEKYLQETGKRGDE